VLSNSARSAEFPVYLKSTTIIHHFGFLHHFQEVFTACSNISVNFDFIFSISILGNIHLLFLNVVQSDPNYKICLHTKSNEQKLRKYFLGSSPFEEKYCKNSGFTFNLLCLPSESSIKSMEYIFLVNEFFVVLVLFQFFCNAF
jgi:hypothetical protein